ncbi:MAG: DNA repair protein RecN [Verrucomicrobia bacterium]|nr:DNA repair protein RecN [Verrucomicrobiota bacterium]
MLVSLRIKNLALVADLTLELQPGCNVITGETGAGKSILIGALNLVLGERADRTLLRSGAESCAVEAVFDITGLPVALKDYLADHGLEPCENQQLMLKRVFTAAGANRQFVNGSPTTLSILATLGEWLVDIHGPHDHQSLLHPARQLAILDAFGGLEKDREAVAERVRRRAGLMAEMAALGGEEQAYMQQLDLLRFQVQEIEAAALQPGEEALIEPEFHRANNAAKLLQFSQAALEVLAEGEDAIVTRMGIVGRTLQELQRVDPSAANLGELHAQAVEILRELQEAISRYGSQVELEPARLAELEERLDLLHSLKRKYGATVDAVLAFGAQARQRLQRLESRDAERERLQAALAQLDVEILHAGKKLSAARKQVIPRLAQAAGRQLADLGFRQGQFEVAIHSATQLPPDATALSPSGLDTIEFLFAPNPGEPARPLRAIASSGEMARVMLALKTVLAAEDEIPVLVFDEVDANVGGETAHAVGEKMKQIAAQRQVICITHLPQVAAPADAHYVVTKRVQAGRTVTEIARLERKERVTELARMLGGQSEAARKHAAALLKTGATPSV